MDRREALGFTRQFLDSPAFLCMFQIAFRPTLKAWIRRLVTEEDLNAGERVGIVTAMRELHAGFVRAFEESELDIPEWLDKEFLRAPLSEQ